MRHYKKQPRARFEAAPNLPLLKGPPLSVVPNTARIVGYARVSREDQNLAMQLAALKAAEVENLFIEKISAVNLKRPQFHLMLKFLEPGDTLVVYAFSRLARDLKQLLTLVDGLKEMGVRLRSTSEPHIDPFTTNGRLLVSVTGAVDENELGRLRDRTRDGMRELKRQGMALGRKAKVSDSDAQKMLTMRKQGFSAAEIARSFRHLKVKPSTVYARTNKLMKT